MRVGLTGGIASGKSSVSRILAELGAMVIDADVLAREVVAKGTPGLAAVLEEFGAQMLGADGELDRARMGALAFGDEDARKRLEAIVHPLVYERIVALESAAGPDDLVVHDIPLLAESGRATTSDRGGFDAVIVVDAPEDVQVARMVRDRGWSEDEARSRIAAQASRADRLAIATHVIENTGTLEDLRDQVTKVFEELHAEG